jgi:serine/threonine protein kinase
VLTPGTTLDGRYEILEPLASGGMGHLYRARRVHLGDEVAVKIVHSQGADPARLRERFLVESRACAQLRHPNIVTVLDFAVDPNGQPFLVMELLNGPSLLQQLQQQGALGPARVVAIVTPLCAALQMAHDRGVLHRDLKPGNIVSHRYESGEVVHKIIDFGLANLRTASDETRLTRAGTFLGTVAYASPEQLRSEPLDPRSDVYSLGTVVFEMLTGRLPFVGEAFATISKKLTEAAPRPSTIRPDVGEGLDEAVSRALALDRDARWPSMAAFAGALEPGAAGRTGTGSVPVALTASEIDTRRAPGLTAKYDIGPRLSTGRMGSTVHAGTHRALGHPVAIRLLRCHDEKMWPAVRSRFLREARTLQVTHPSLLHVRDFGEEGDLLYVVTDLVEGARLRATLDAHPRGLSWDLAGPFVADIADATAQLHRRGGLVCGLTPDLMWVTTDGERQRILISSGGICQIQDLLATLSEQTVRGTGAVEPDLFYVAPEVLTGRPPDARADVYAVGVIAYELVTGTVPFTAETLPALTGRVMRGDALDPGAGHPDVPPTAAAVILRALSVDPQDRHADAREFLRAWQETLSLEP